MNSVLPFNAMSRVRRLATFGVQYGCALLIFLIPVHTALILRQGWIGKAGTPYGGVWEYGTIHLFVWDAVFLLVLIFTLIDFVVARRASAIRFRFPSPRLLFGWRGLLAAFILIAGVSVVWAPDRILAGYKALRLVQAVGVFFILRAYANRRGCERALIASCVVQALWAIWQYTTQEIVASSWLGTAFHAPEQLGDSVVEDSETRWLRAYGGFPHPNILAAFLSAGVLMTFSHLRNSSSRRETFALTVSAAILFAGLVYTFSRVAWIAVALAALVAIALYAYSRVKQGERYVFFFRDGTIAPLTVGIVACAIFVAVIVSGAREPLAVRLGFGGLHRLEKRSIDEHALSLVQGVDFLKRSPLVGSGIGNETLYAYRDDQKSGVRRFSYQYQPTHNYFLLVAVELGLIGAACLALFLIFFLVENASTIFVRTNPWGWVLGIFFILGLFDHFFWSLPSGVLFWWVVLGLLSPLRQRPS